MVQICVGYELTGLDLLGMGFPDVQFKELYTTGGPSLPDTASKQGDLWEGRIQQWPRFFENMKSPLRLPKSSNALAHVPHSRYRRVKKSQLPELQLEQAKIDEGSHDLAQTQKAMDQTIHAEHFVTGEEKGCEQAFGHHAMNVLSAIAGDSGLPFRFGNYRACHGGRAETRAEKTAGSAAGEERLNANRKQPDFVGMSFGVKPASREQPDRQMRMCGTVKGSWDDDLAELFGTMQAPFLRVRSGAQADEERRIWMSQLANYLQRFRLKYGFLTVERYTVFTKLEVDSFGAPTLWVSPAIRASDRSEDQSVSVRACLWWMMTTVTEGPSEDSWRISKQAHEALLERTRLRKANKSTANTSLSKTRAQKAAHEAASTGDVNNAMQSMSLDGRGAQPRDVDQEDIASSSSSAPTAAGQTASDGRSSSTMRGAVLPPSMRRVQEIQQQPGSTAGTQSEAAATSRPQTGSSSQSAAGPNGRSRSERLQFGYASSQRQQHCPAPADMTAPRPSSQRQASGGNTERGTSQPSGSAQEARPQSSAPLIRTSEETASSSTGSLSRLRSGETGNKAAAGSSDTATSRLNDPAAASSTSSAGAGSSVLPPADVRKSSIRGWLVVIDGKEHTPDMRHVGQSSRAKSSYVYLRRERKRQLRFTGDKERTAFVKDLSKK